MRSWLRGVCRYPTPSAGIEAPLFTWTLYTSDLSPSGARWVAVLLVAGSMARAFSLVHWIVSHFYKQDTLYIFTLKVANRTITQCVVKKSFEIACFGQVLQFSNKFSDGLTV